MLSTNDFPEKVIKKLTKRASQKSEGKADKIKEMKNVLCLPYVGEQNKRKVMKILRKAGILKHTRVCFKPDKKLKEIVSRSALRPTPCNKKNDNTCYSCDDTCMNKNIVYLLTCSICGEKYTGETGRCKRSRCWEHYKSAREMSSDTAMGNHYRLHHSEEDFPLEPFEFKILKVCRDFADRMLWQSMFIKELSPKINTQLSQDTDSWKKTTWAVM